MELDVWTWPEAAARTSRVTARARVRRGVWQSPFRGVYVGGSHPLSPEEWALAATLATGGRAPVGAARAVASGRTAARVWGLSLIDDDDPATSATEKFLHEVTTPRGVQDLRPQRKAGAPPVHELFRVRRRLRPHEVTWHAAGFWLTTALRTAVDCVPSIGLEASVCLLDDGLRRRLFTSDGLEREVVRRTGQPGSRAFARAVALTDGRSESAAETLARLLLLPVLPGLVPQVKIRDGRRIVARVDLGDEQTRLAVEVDGKLWHSGEPMVAKDRNRDRRLERLGWWTERCTWHDVRCLQDELIERMVWRDAQLRRKAA